MQFISDIKRIQQAKANNKLVVFVGAGVSNNSGVPSWGKLIESLKNELPIEEIEDENDSLKIAEYYYNFRGQKEYLEKIKEVLKYGKVSYNPIHNVILDLEPSHIITTNYDDLIEQSIKPRNLQYHIIKKDADLPYIQTDRLVVKMHGDFDTGNIVLKEKDYLDYSTKFPLIDSFVKSLFATKFVLFVGFSFSDYNLRFILNYIQTLLQDDFQPVYMLVHENVNFVVKDYYKKKGINLVEITEQQLNEVLLEQNIETQETDSFENPLGKILYKQLRLISEYEENLNLIDYLYSNLMPYEEVLPVLGNGLRNFFPKKEVKYWHLYSKGLQIESPFIKNEVLKHKDSISKYRFLKEYSFKLDKLFKIAYYNNIYEIDDVSLFTKSIQRRINRFNSEDCIDLFYKCNYKGVVDEIKRLTLNKLTFTKTDLELPHILYITGNYYEAYFKYKELSLKYWEKQKYILYFICVYNQKMVGYLAAHDSKFIDEASIRKEVNAIDLVAVLSRCSIDKKIAKVFSDLISNKYYLTSVKEINDLMLNLYDDKKRADNGGWSSNSHVDLLISNIYRLINFGDVNHIICLDNEYSRQCFRNAIAGLLLNHSIKTKDDEIFKSPKIEKINRVNLKIMLYYIKLSELKLIFDRYDVMNISLSKDAYIFINQVLDNLITNNKDSIKLIVNCNYYDVVQQLIFLLLKANRPIDITISDKIYEIFLKYELHKGKSTLLQVNSSIDLFDLLSELIDSNPPNHELALKLLNPILLQKKGWHKSHKFVKSISNVIAKNNLILEEIKDISQLNFSDVSDWAYLSALYPIMSIKVKKQILQHLQKMHLSIDYMFISKIYGEYNIPIFNLEVIERYLSSIKKQNIFYTNLLLEVRKDQRCKSAHSKIDETIKESEYLKFIRNPQGYTNYSLIDPEWLLFCEESDFKKIIQIDIVNKKVKSSFETEWFGKTLKKRFLLYA